MRKSVLFLLGVLYLVSVVVVTFFGIQARMDQFKVYITSLEITNHTGQMKNGEKYITLEFNSTGGDPISMFVETKIEPSNATNTKLRYVVTNNKGEPAPEVTVTDLGEVCIMQEFKGTLLLTIETTDGSNLKDSAILLC